MFGHALPACWVNNGGLFARNDVADQLWREGWSRNGWDARKVDWLVHVPWQKWEQEFPSAEEAPLRTNVMSYLRDDGEFRFQRLDELCYSAVSSGAVDVKIRGSFRDPSGISRVCSMRCAEPAVFHGAKMGGLYVTPSGRDLLMRTTDGANYIRWIPVYYED